jgi:phosphocarrier protein
MQKSPAIKDFIEKSIDKTAKMLFNEMSVEINRAFARCYSEVKLMVIKEAEIRNEIGLHARPATLFVQKANEHKASIWLEKDERRVNAKSLLGVLSLGVTDKSKVKIIAEGSGEEAAAEDLVALIENNFSDADAATA